MSQQQQQQQQQQQNIVDLNVNVIIKIIVIIIHNNNISFQQHTKTSNQVAPETIHEQPLGVSGGDRPFRILGVQQLGKLLLLLLPVVRRRRSLLLLSLSFVVGEMPYSKIQYPVIVVGDDDMQKHILFCKHSLTHSNISFFQKCFYSFLLLQPSVVLTK